jgi:hypothetical protein
MSTANCQHGTILRSPLQSDHRNERFQCASITLPLLEDASSPLDTELTDDSFLRLCEDFFVTSDIAPETGSLEASSVEDSYQESSTTSKGSRTVIDLTRDTSDEGANRQELYRAVRNV